MRRVVVLLFAWCLVQASTVVAQRSCVFVDHNNAIGSEAGEHAGFADRPRTNAVRLRWIAPLAGSPLLFDSDRTNFHNVLITADPSNRDQDEPSVAISPLDPSVIIAGANDYRSDKSLWAYASTDNGLTWSNQELPEQTSLQYATDPALAFDSKGVAYFSSGRTNGFGIPYPANEVVVYSSTNKGSSWSSPARVFQDLNDNAQELSDKYYLAVDRWSSAFKDRIYIVWVQDSNGTSKIVSSYSTDQGKHWSARVYLTSTGSEYVSPIPAIGSNGELYVTFADKSSAKKEILFCRSTNGGVSFSAPVKVANYLELGPTIPPTEEGHPRIKGHVRVNSFPAIAVDHSTKASGRIYLVWAAKGPDNKLHIYLTSSDNGGGKWSAAKVVESDPNQHATDKFFPWIAVDQTSGDIAVAFYDSRIDSLYNELIDCFMSFSRDGGATFISRRISSISSDSHISATLDSLASSDTSVFFGDYINIAGASGVYHPVWTDSRTRISQDIYTAVVRPYAPAVVTELVAIDTLNGKALLRWKASGATTFGFPLTTWQVHIHRQDGGVDTILTGNEVLDTTVSAGTSYSYSVQVVSGLDTSIALHVVFSPEAYRTAQAPEMLNAQATQTGLDLTYKIPSKNVAGEPLDGLTKLFFIVDNVYLDSIDLTNADTGKTGTRSLTLLDGYHSVQVVVQTVKDHYVTPSLRSPLAYLYAGAPLPTYSTTFNDGKNIFSPFAWDTTTAQGYFATPVLNDSLARVNYRATTNSWFLLPAVAINLLNHTLEFDHISLVAEGDSALIEVSTDDGIHFTPVAFFDHNRDLTWQAGLSDSRMRHERISLQRVENATAVVRFRLHTRSENGDGWYLDNINLSDADAVRQYSLAVHQLQFKQNPVEEDKPVVARIDLASAASLRYHVTTLLGQEVRRGSTSILRSGRYELDLGSFPEGLYLIELQLDSPQGIQYYTGKVIVQ